MLHIVNIKFSKIIETIRKYRSGRPSLKQIVATGMSTTHKYNNNNNNKDNVTILKTTTLTLPF